MFDRTGSLDIFLEEWRRNSRSLPGEESRDSGAGAGDLSLERLGSKFLDNSMEDSENLCQIT